MVKFLILRLNFSKMEVFAVNENFLDKKIFWTKIQLHKI